MEPRGKTLLKVVGILLIIGAILGILLNILGLTMGSVMLNFAGGTEYPALTEALDTALVISCVIGLVVGVIQLLSGICGVRNCKNVGAAKLCFNYGVLLIILGIASIAVGYFTGLYQTMSIAVMISSMVGSLLLPVLYTIGASMNKKEM